MEKAKIVIVGGVAGGANVATRARRLSESAEIIILERGPYLSFANCGLPYHIGGEIKDRSRLVLQNPESFQQRYRIDARVENEVLEINRNNKTVNVKDSSGKTYQESYTHLVLATGAAPLKPAIPGIESSGHFSLRTMGDMDKIIDWIKNKPVKKVVVIGGGYIGLELLEQLVHYNFELSLVEALPQVMAPLDPEMAELLHQEIKSKGVNLYLGNTVKKFAQPEGEEKALASIVETNNGMRLEADMVILGLGVKPEIALAKTAGLEIGMRGGIKVNEYLETSDSQIYAIGDVIEVKDFVTEELVVIPLAGPANRQGRLVADNILGKKATYNGTLGTAVLRLFDLVVACTGANEKTLKRLALAYQTLSVHPMSHASYYPGATATSLKILFSPDSGKILGAQAVGKENIDKRIDVIATAIKAGLTVDDLADLEHCYAPPFGSAKDPINIAGMAAQNILRGYCKTISATELPSLGNEVTILDVRDDKEREAGFIPNSIHIPINQLRDRLSELPKDKEVVAYCHSGQRSYYACRILLQNDYHCRNLSGAYKTWQLSIPLN